MPQTACFVREKCDFVRQERKNCVLEKCTRLKVPFFTATGISKNAYFFQISRHSLSSLRCHNITWPVGSKQLKLQTFQAEAFNAVSVVFFPQVLTKILRRDSVLQMKHSSQNAPFSDC